MHENHADRITGSSYSTQYRNRFSSKFWTHASRARDWATPVSGRGITGGGSEYAALLVLHFCAVTVSSTGPRKLFKEMTTATSVVLARFPWLLSIRNPCELRGPCRHSYFGPRTCGGGENQCHRSGWVLNQGLTFSPLMSTFVFSF